MRLDTKSLRNHLRFTLSVIGFLLPTLIGLLVFQYIPLVVAVRNSFFRLSLLNPNAAVYIGFSNYINIIDDTVFWKSITNTLLYAGGKILIQIPLALFLAIILNRQIKGMAIVRSALFAPLVTSGAVVAVIWNLMYHPDNGILNALLLAFGLAKQPFLVSTDQALISILIMGIWQDVGFSMLLILAGLQNIPEVYYEAASIDGAGFVDNFRYITIPLLRRTLLFTIVVATIFSFRVFTPIYVMTRGGPSDATLLSVYYIFKQGFQLMNMGYASAMAVMLILLLIAITFIQSRVLRTEFEY